MDPQISGYLDIQMPLSDFPISLDNKSSPHVHSDGWQCFQEYGLEERSEDASRISRKSPALVLLTRVGGVARVTASGCPCPEV